MMIPRLHTTLNRIILVSKHAPQGKGEEIDQFINEIRKKQQWLSTRITTVSENIQEIEGAMARSNPELSLDPQMEPLITLFTNDVEDVYSSIHECIAKIKEFEHSLTEIISGEMLLALTDTVLAEIQQVFARGDLDKTNTKKLSQAQKLQETAHSHLQNGSVIKAARVSQEAFYAIIDIIPEGQDKITTQARYETLKKQLGCVKDLMKNSADERILLLFSLAQEHIHKAHMHMQKKDETKAGKELDICGVLVTKVSKLLVQ